MPKLISEEVTKKAVFQPDSAKHILIYFSSFAKNECLCQKHFFYKKVLTFGALNITCSKLSWRKLFVPPEKPF